MIEFERVRYKNLLAVGNAWVEIDLNKSPSTLIIGKNGHGKTTLFEAVTFGLFGKPFRDIPKGLLVNSINKKQCMVEISFSIGPIKYMVRRGIKPDVFEIYQDGEMLKQLPVREYQALLEEQILHMNMKTFQQVVLLSVSNFKPFMTLETAERRGVIEDILDLTLFSDLNAALKGKMSKAKEILATADQELSLHKQKAMLQQQYIDRLLQDRKDRVDSITESIQSASAQVEEAGKAVSDLLIAVEALRAETPDSAGISDEIASVREMSRRIEDKRREVNQLLDFYSNNHNCPTCKQGIDEAFRMGHVEANTKKLDDIAKGAAMISTKMAALDAKMQVIRAKQAEINALNSQINQKNAEIRSDNNMIARLQAERDALQNQEPADIESEKQKLKDLATAAIELITAKATAADNKQVYDVIATLLKDNAIKADIIEHYVPIINKLINGYLEAMDIWISFHLDSNFSEHIKSRHRDQFVYHSFSAGEKQRIDLAILFTWRAIARMRNSVNTNLLMLDEILDTCLDDDGVAHVLGLLTTLGTGTNLFVISHKVDLLIEHFRNVIKFEKVDNFTQIAK